MPYSAIVLDNTEFFTKGTITVRVAKYYNAEFIWDLSNDTNILKDFESIKNDNKKQVEDFNNCLVSTPIGGGRNYGFFALPQINSVGRVSFLDDAFRTPIWEGSFYRPHKGDDFIVDYIGIPNDQPDKEGVDTDGARKGNNLEGGEGTIILRQKSTTSAEHNWEENNTENLIVLDNDRLKIIHFLEWDSATPKKWQEITIENGELNIVVKNDTDDKTATLLVKEDEVSTELDNGGESTKLTVSISNPSFKFEGLNNMEFLGTGDFLAKYTDLVDIIEKLAQHSHVCPISGTTPPPLDAGAPLASAITNAKQNMKAERLKTE